MPVYAHERHGKKGSNRNYAAMAIPKLRRSVKELTEKRGEAYLKCIQKGGDPDIDLIVATEVLMEKEMEG